MLDRDVQLREFFVRKWPLLKVHYPKEIHGDIVVCSCHLGINCPEQNKGKHPAFKGGVNGALPVDSVKGFGDWNIGIACGGGFVVLDIDPRNGGTETLAGLEATHGALPPTWTVCTGGGGTHYYYSVEGTQKTQNALQACGVELKGAGSYVLCPGSNHKSGRQYDWAPDHEPEDLPLAPLPAWVLEVTKAGGCGEPCETPPEERIGESTLYSREELLEAFTFIDPDMGGDKTWKDLAMGLAAGGFEFEHFLAISNGSAHGKPSVKFQKCGEAGARKAWNDQVKKIAEGKSYYSIGTVIKMAQDGGWELKQTTPDPIKRREVPEVVEEPIVIEEKTEEEIDFPPGLLGELARDIYKNAVNKSQKFAIASAIIICSSIAQGEYLSPTYGVLGVYYLMIAEVGEGKGDYLKPIKSTLEEVMKKISSKNSLTLKKPKSSHYLSNSLNKFNCGSLVIDEGLKWLSQNIASKDACSLEINDFLLSAWSGNDTEGFGTKDEENETEGVKSPRICFSGFGATKFLEFFLREGAISAEDGLLSRMCLIPDSMPDDDNEEWKMSPPYKPSDALVASLVAPVASWKVDYALVDPKSKTMAALNVNGEVLVKWSSEVEKAYGRTAKEFKKKKRAEEYGGIVWARYAEMALRTASVMAVFDKSEVTMDRLEWALLWQKARSMEMLEFCESHLGKSPETICREKILEAARRAGGTITLGKIQAHWKAFSNVPQQIRTAALRRLQEEGEIEPIRPGQRGGLQIIVKK